MDDSIVSRSWIANALAADPVFEIVAVATSSKLAFEVVVSQAPQILILNGESERLNGLALLEKVMMRFPTRTIVVSEFCGSSSKAGLKALSFGAVDVFSRVEISSGRRINVDPAKFRACITSAIRARLPMANSSITVAHTPTVVLAIAASTGGPDALQALLSRLPANIPPMLIVQHMPAFYTRSFARRLNEECSFEVREARDGDSLQEGLALIAPGGFHMTVEKNSNRFSIALDQSPPLHGVRPAADPLFESIARNFGARAIGVVLTGMGRDGAEGLAKMRKSGSFNIAQDEQSSVVFGMAREAVAAGAVQIVCPLDKIAGTIIAELARRTVAKVG